ncbi:MAG: helix-turn-helix transcriptional regulator [Planctomycetes bacterium]|nr:helix-turn-helix transcriptional regulator [Planctomycetota bacterium]
MPPLAPSARNPTRGPGANCQTRAAHTPLYDEFRRRLAELRRSAGLTQRALAARLGREHSFVARLELGERRLDVVEFYWLCGAVGVDPVKEAGRAMEAMRARDRGRGGPVAGKRPRARARRRSRGHPRMIHTDDKGPGALAPEPLHFLERVKGFEPSTFSLGS